MRRKILIKVEKGCEVSFEEAHIIPSAYVNSLFPKNKWHGTRYTRSISSLQGGVMNPLTKKLTFPNNAWFFVSSDDSEFISGVTIGVFSNRNIHKGMTFENVSFADFNCHKDKGKSDGFDIIQTISPVKIDVKENGILKCLTLEDEGYLDTLLSQTKNKLRYRASVSEEVGSWLTDEMIDGIHFELCGDINHYKHKKRFIKLHGKPNMCCGMTLKVTGRKETREFLYNIGLGNSTGYGFGAVNIIY